MTDIQLTSRQNVLAMPSRSYSYSDIETDALPTGGYACGDLATTDVFDQNKLTGQNQQAPVDEVLVDVVVVYAKNDYDAVLDFIVWLKSLVPSKDIRIYHFDDDERFNPDKVGSVEEFVSRTMHAFMYLTPSFAQDINLEFVTHESIAQTRLAEGIDASRFASTFLKKNKYAVRPVHTQKQAHRQYRTPCGLNSLRSIDYYDKSSRHTQDKTRKLLQEAIRKREVQEEGLRQHTEYNRTMLQQQERTHYGGIENYGRPSKTNANMNSSVPAEQMHVLAVSTAVEKSLINDQKMPIQPLNSQHGVETNITGDPSVSQRINDTTRSGGIMSAAAGSGGVAVSGGTMSTTAGSGGVTGSGGSMSTAAGSGGTMSTTAESGGVMSTTTRSVGAMSNNDSDYISDYGRSGHSDVTRMQQQTINTALSVKSQDQSDNINQSHNDNGQTLGASAGQLDKALGDDHANRNTTASTSNSKIGSDPSREQYRSTESQKPVSTPETEGKSPENSEGFSFNDSKANSPDSASTVSSITESASRSETESQTNTSRTDNQDESLRCLDSKNLDADAGPSTISDTGVIEERPISTRGDGYQKRGKAMAGANYSEYPYPPPPYTRHEQDSRRDQRSLQGQGYSGTLPSSGTLQQDGGSTYSQFPPPPPPPLHYGVPVRESVHIHYHYGPSEDTLPGRGTREPPPQPAPQYQIMGCNVVQIGAGSTVVQSDGAGNINDQINVGSPNDMGQNMRQDSVTDDDDDEEEEEEEEGDDDDGNIQQTNPSHLNARREDYEGGSSNLSYDQYPSNPLHNQSNNSDDQGYQHDEQSDEDSDEKSNYLDNHLNEGSLCLASTPGSSTLEDNTQVKGKLKSETTTEIPSEQNSTSDGQHVNIYTGEGLSTESQNYCEPCVLKGDHTCLKVFNNDGNKYSASEPCGGSQISSGTNTSFSLNSATSSDRQTLTESSAFQRSCTMESESVRGDNSTSHRVGLFEINRRYITGSTVQRTLKPCVHVEGSGSKHNIDDEEVD